jgi:hypothetical protein
MLMKEQTLTLHHHQLQKQLSVIRPLHHHLRLRQLLIDHRHHHQQLPSNQQLYLPLE